MEDYRVEVAWVKCIQIRNSKFEQAVARGERETNIFGLKQVVSDVFKCSKNEGIKRSNTASTALSSKMEVASLKYELTHCLARNNNDNMCALKLTYITLSVGNCVL